MADKVDVSVIVPIGPGHELIADRAIASIEAQTVKAAPIIISDLDKRGAGWARNQGLSQVRTPWFLPLDADDWFETAAVERFLTVARLDRYVYSDWYEDGIAKQAPDRPWCGGTWHTISSLIPTDAAWRVGGFDERLPAMEDTDFYLKLTRRGRICGLHLPEPLVHYQLNAQGRSHQFKASADFEHVMDELTRRYSPYIMDNVGIDGRKINDMGCCGDDTVSLPPTGERQQGDVLAMAMWAGNRVKQGRATGRIYPRMSYPRAAWIDPRDVQAAPMDWRPIDNPSAAAMQGAAGNVRGAAGMVQYGAQYGNNGNGGRQFLPGTAPVIKAEDGDDRRVIPQPGLQGIEQIANAANAIAPRPVYRPPFAAATIQSDANLSPVERVQKLVSNSDGPVTENEPAPEVEPEIEKAPTRKRGRPARKAAI